jgi:PAS domain S-box-containing protein
MDGQTVIDTDVPDFRQMIDSITECGVIRLDPDGRVRSWHPGAERLTGYRTEEIVGRPVSLLYGKEDADAGVAEREMAAAVRDGRFETEGWRVHKDGTRFWAWAVLTPIRDAHGAVEGFVQVARDVSGQREQELKLREAEQMLEAITDYEVIRLSPDGMVQSWSPGAMNLKQYTEEEVLGRHVSMFYPEEDVKSGLADREMAAAVREGRFESEGWRVRKDGSRFWAWVVLAPILDADGMVQGFVKVARDLSERREQELVVQRQRDEILELSTPVIQVWDKVLVLPIIGTLDSMRASRLTESLLERISLEQAEVVILDVSGVPAIDTDVAQHLLKTVEAARLMGTVSVLSGVRPETAQAMVHLGIDLGSLRSRTTLKDALKLALRLVDGHNPAERAGG